MDVNTTHELELELMNQAHNHLLQALQFFGKIHSAGTLLDVLDVTKDVYDAMFNLIIQANMVLSRDEFVRLWDIRGLPVSPEIRQGTDLDDIEVTVAEA